MCNGRAVLAKVACVILSGTLMQSWVGAQALDEEQVKGAYLLNFAQFVKWPDKAFKSSTDAISICILGDVSFTPGLDRAARTVTAGARSVTVRRISDVREVHSCHVTFVGDSERKRVRAVLREAKGESVLTVGESAGFISSGGTIEFRVEENKVRMQISE